MTTGTLLFEASCGAAADFLLLPENLRLLKLQTYMAFRRRKNRSFWDENEGDCQGSVRLGDQFSSLQSAEQLQ
eukprot:16977-Heterococcus_DN1.PRE.4